MATPQTQRPQQVAARAGNSGPWPFMNVGYRTAPPVPESPATAAWLAYPFHFGLLTTNQIVAQPRNLVLHQPELRGVYQVIAAQAFANRAGPNLVVPQPALVQGSKVSSWLAQILLAAQGRLPGSP